MSVVAFVVQESMGPSPATSSGRLAVWTINRMGLANPQATSCSCWRFAFFSFAFTDLVGGNGYLAVYLSGLVIGNHKLVQKRPLTVFFDGFTWSYRQRLPPLGLFPQ